MPVWCTGSIWPPRAIVLDGAWGRGAATSLTPCLPAAKSSNAMKPWLTASGRPDPALGAAAAGHPIDLPLKLDWPNRPRSQVDRVSGKPSLTRCRVLCVDATRADHTPAARTGDRSFTPVAGAPDGHRPPDSRATRCTRPRVPDQVMAPLAATRQRATTSAPCHDGRHCTLSASHRSRAGFQPRACDPACCRSSGSFFR
jgi:hypothetical protein